MKMRIMMKMGLIIKNKMKIRLWGTTTTIMMKVIMKWKIQMINQIYLLPSNSSNSPSFKRTNCKS